MSLKEGSPTFSCSPMVLLLTLWILFADITMAGPHYTTYSRTYRTLTHGISVLDIPSADTNRCSRISLSQQLSVSDRVVTPPYCKYTSQMLLHSSADLTAYHIIYPSDTTHKMPEDCCLEGWSSLQFLLRLDRCVC